MSRGLNSLRSRRNRDLLAVANSRVPWSKQLSPEFLWIAPVQPNVSYFLIFQAFQLSWKHFCLLSEETKNSFTFRRCDTHDERDVWNIIKENERAESKQAQERRRKSFRHKFTSPLCIQSTIFRDISLSLNRYQLKIGFRCRRAATWCLQPPVGLLNGQINLSFDS